CKSFPEGLQLTANSGVEQSCMQGSNIGWRVMTVLKKADTRSRMLRGSTLVDLRQVSAESFRRQEHAGQGKLLVEEPHRRRSGKAVHFPCEVRLVRESAIPGQRRPLFLPFRRHAGQQAMEPCRLGEQLRTQADLLSEPAFERTLAPSDRPGEMIYRNEAAMLEDFANRANGARMGSSGRGYPLEEK